MPPQGDIMFLGSPVRMGSVTGRAKRYVKKLDAVVWKGKPIVVFTTTLMLPEDATDEQKRSQDGWDRTAGGKLGDLAKSRGLGAVENHPGVEVKGMKGPLAETGVEKTRRFTSDILASLKDGSAPEGRSVSAAEQTDRPDSLRLQVIRQPLGGCSSVALVCPPGLGLS